MRKGRATERPPGHAGTNAPIGDFSSGKENAEDLVSCLNPLLALEGPGCCILHTSIIPRFSCLSQMYYDQWQGFCMKRKNPTQRGEARNPTRRGGEPGDRKGRHYARTYRLGESASVVATLAVAQANHPAQQSYAHPRLALHGQFAPRDASRYKTYPDQ